MNDNCEVETLRRGLDQMTGTGHLLNVDHCSILANYIADSSISYLCREDDSVREVVRNWIWKVIDILDEINCESSELHCALQRVWNNTMESEMYE